MMALSNPITELLLSMKLTGMEEAFAEQLRTPGHRELDFEDRLALLLEREREHRRDRSCQWRSGTVRWERTQSPMRSLIGLSTSPTTLNSVVIRCAGAASHRRSNAVRTGTATDDADA